MSSEPQQLTERGTNDGVATQNAETPTGEVSRCQRDAVGVEVNCMCQYNIGGNSPYDCGTVSDRRQATAVFGGGLR